MNNIGLSGVLSIWLVIIYVSGWPVLITAVYILSRRRHIGRKWLFGAIGVLLGYCINFVTSVTTADFIHATAGSMSQGAEFDALVWTLRLVYAVEALLLVLLLFLLERRFKNAFLQTKAS